MSSKRITLGIVNGIKCEVLLGTCWETHRELDGNSQKIVRFMDCEELRTWSHFCCAYTTSLGSVRSTSSWTKRIWDAEPHLHNMMH
jgi:hypothetical protein